MNHIKLFLEYKKIGRSIELSESEFMDMVKSNCKEWISNPSMLIRARRDDGGISKYSYTNPKNFIRKSINKSDHITMIIDEFPSWSEFPKRKNSIIFSHNMKYNNGTFGSNLFFVIPFDGAKFGVVPSNDLWSLSNKKMPILSLTESLSDEFLKLGAPEEYKSFVKWSNNLFSMRDLKGVDMNGGRMTTKIYVEYQKYLTDGGSDDFIEWFDYIMSPENWHRKGGGDESETTKVMDYDELVKVNNNDYGNECWTESTCLYYFMGKDISWRSGDDHICFTSDGEKIFSEFLDLFK